MGERRTAFTLSPLPGGRVLAAGGGNGEAHPRLGELFDGRQCAADPAHAAPPPAHTATTLPSGKVLVAGGYRRQRRGDHHRALRPRDQRLDAGRLARAATVRADTTALADGRVLSGRRLRRRRDRRAVVGPTTALTTDPSLSFGGREIGTTAGAALQLTNTGDAPLWADDFALGGRPPGRLRRQRRPLPRADRRGCDVRGRRALHTRRGRPAQRHADVRRQHRRPHAGRAAERHRRDPGAGRDSAEPGPDGDGDGVPDTTDHCLSLTGPAARTGCPTGLLNDPSIRYRPVAKGIRVIAYSVKATTGARIEVACSRGCKRTVAKGRGAKAVLISGLKGRRLANGTRVTVTVSMPGRLTTTVYDSIARGRRSEGRPRCTAPGTLGPLLGC